VPLLHRGEYLSASVGTSVYAAGATRVAYDVGVYALYVYLADFPGWMVMTAIAFLVQSLVPRKPIGHVIVILVWVGNIVSINLGYDYRLLQIGGTPLLRWSVLNGTGPYLRTFPAIQGFNLGVTALLLALTAVVWTRGTSMRALGGRARQRFRGATRWLAASGALGATAAGGVSAFGSLSPSK
jgi:hypothetical protein